MPCRARAATRRELAPHPLHPRHLPEGGGLVQAVESSWVGGGWLGCKVSYGLNLRPCQVEEGNC